MRVEPTKQAALGQTNNFADDLGREAERQHDEADASVQESRELVATGQVAGSQGAAVYREAAFLAHLIATKEKVPQTRERRRAEPSEAIAAYRTAIALVH
jgi:hypothetical protein